MTPLRSLALAGVALALLAASSDAQKSVSKKLRRYTKPMRSYSLDLGTGTLTRGPTVGERGVTTVADYSNIDINGFLGADTGGGTCEWFDAGTKGHAGNASDLMSGIAFFYCTAMLSTNSGGPGSSVKLGFYEGYTVGDNMGDTWVPYTWYPIMPTGDPPICLAPATYQSLAGAFTLTGLPGHSVFSSVWFSDAHDHF